MGRLLIVRVSDPTAWSAGKAALRGRRVTCAFARTESGTTHASPASTKRGATPSPPPPATAGPVTLALMSEAATISTAAAPPTAPPPLRARLHDFYRVHAPAKAAHADAIAAAYAGRDASLFAYLERRYLAPGYFAWPATDCRSEFFDARAALYADDALPPGILARPLDTVHKAQVLLPGGPEGTVRLGIIHSDEVALSDARTRQCASASRARGRETLLRRAVCGDSRGPRARTHPSVVSAPRPTYSPG